MFESTPKDLTERARRNAQVYADSFQQTAEIYDQHEVYESMAQFVLLVQQLMQRRYQLPQDRPMVHVDLGSGTGHLLEQLATACKAARKEFCLIGIDINDILLTHSAQRLRSQGHEVDVHLCAEERVQQQQGRLVLRRSYGVNHARMKAMDLTPGERIVLLQQDIRREMPALNTVLETLRAADISHVDSVSFGMPGFGADMAIQDSPDLHLSNEVLLKRETGRLMQELCAGALRTGKRILGLGGMFVTFQRMMRGAPLKEFYERTIGNPMPEQEQDQVAAKMFLAQIGLGKEAAAFHPRTGAVLLPQFEMIESQTPMRFAGYGGAARHTKQMQSIAECDLFALGLIRADLHAPGKYANTFVVEKREHP